MKAQDIMNLLAKKHEDDIFVYECKDGSTSHRASHHKIDAIAIPRSWSKFSITGYEVKVTRQDFFNDKKWRNYLPMCHALYFVTPYNLIKKEDVPECCGLLQTTEDGTKLRLIKRALIREIETPVEMLKFILICRAKIINNGLVEWQENKDYWAEWYTNKKENQLLGRSYSKKLRQVLDDQIKAVQTKQQALEKEIEGLEEFKKIAEDLGIRNFASYASKKYAVDKLKEKITAETVVNFLNMTIKNIESIKYSVQSMLNVEEPK
jgi:hypothetical protein